MKQRYIIVFVDMWMKYNIVVNIVDLRTKVAYVI